LEYLKWEAKEMRRNFLHESILVLALCISSVAGAETQWNVGISGGSEGISGFHVSVGNYYRVPEREVVIVRERGIPEEELPVVFFLCRHARVSPDVVIALRSRGFSWFDITIHLGLTPEIYYVPVVVYKDGPPYGHAYGHYRNNPKGKWSKAKFTDPEIVNQVNLEFISKQYEYDPARVMKMREMGTSFTTIERKVYREKERGEKANYREVNSRSVRSNDHEGKGKDRNEDWIPPGKGRK
jgi:hypothetical protein